MSRSAWAAAFLAVAVAVAVGAIVTHRWTGTPLPTDATGERSNAGSERRASAQPDAEPARDRAGRPALPDADAGLSRSKRAADVDGERLPTPWAFVDMDEVRAAMPRNLYWQLAAPTQDARALQEREEERARLNDELGKVLSGTATEEEIHAYYAYRRRLSTDYLEFVSYVLDHYGATLPERDVGLLELARRLHRARLEEIPRRTQEALQRRQAQEAARKAWLAGERNR